MKMLLSELRKMIAETAGRSGHDELRKGDLVEIHESYEERRRHKAFVRNQNLLI